MSAAYHQLAQVDAQSARAAGAGHARKRSKRARRASVPYASSVKCRRLLGNPAASKAPKVKKAAKGRGRR
jgi:Tfp pilus assembly protein FimV